MKHECDDERQQTSSRGGESGLAQTETLQMKDSNCGGRTLCSPLNNAGKVQIPDLEGKSSKYSSI